MRLTSATVSGFGRLVNSKINLDGKVIAIVGPNEAGKTTLLKALSFLTTGGTLPVSERSRSSSVTDDTTVIEATFIVEPSDLESLTTQLHAPPQTIRVGRYAEGTTRFVGISPPPIPSVDTLQGISERLSEILNEPTSFANAIVSTSPYAPGGDRSSNFTSDLKAVQRLLTGASNGSAITSLRTDEAKTLVEGLVEALNDADLPTSLRSTLKGIGDWQAKSDPEPEVRRKLATRIPKFLLFDEAERSIASSYVIDQNLVAATPPAIRNLAQIAGLDLNDLQISLNAGDVSRWLSSIRKCNAALRKIFERSWNQSNLTVELGVNGNLLQVLITENSVDITPFDERSAGLKMFVALTAFLLANDIDSDVVLLIDEAENHLHIDAQADLVEMLTRQNRASRVIYTTHSPACLPQDLGRNVRAVLPVGADRQASRISNHFWTEAGAGFSPLLIAMGAGAAAFSAARRVVLGEGATEMVLLPSLIRSVTDLPVLPYQVAPGLSETPRRLYPQLDLEGARVAFLVDGDDGGSRLRNELENAGILDSRIVQLDAPTIENLLEPENYRDVLFELLTDAGHSTTLASLPHFTSEDSWPSLVKRWSLEQGIDLPSKVAVASRLLETDRAVVRAPMKPVVDKLHADLMRSLDR